MGWPPGTQRGRRGFSSHHFRRRRPRRIDALVGDAGNAGPAALLARNGDRIADGLAGRGDEVEPPVAEADDDLAWLVLRAEAHVLAAAAADRAAAAPVPEQLRRRRCGAEACRRHDGPRCDGRGAQQACDAHRFELPLSLAVKVLATDLAADPAPAPMKSAFIAVPFSATRPLRPSCTASPHATPRKTRAKRPRFQTQRPTSPEAPRHWLGRGPEATQGNVIRALKCRVCSILCAFSHMRVGRLHKNASAGSFPQDINGISLRFEKAHNVRATRIQDPRRHVRDLEARPPRLHRRCLCRARRKRDSRGGAGPLGRAGGGHRVAHRRPDRHGEVLHDLGRQSVRGGRRPGDAACGRQRRRCGHRRAAGAQPGRAAVLGARRRRLHPALGRRQPEARRL